MIRLDPQDPQRLELIAHVADLNEDEALLLVDARLTQGCDPLSIVEDCQEGLRQVGERYEKQQYFLSGLIMAGEIFREVMEKVQPSIEQQLTGNETGTILLGTVTGDIHDIGKNIVTFRAGYRRRIRPDPRELSIAVRRITLTPM